MCACVVSGGSGQKLWGPGPIVFIYQYTEINVGILSLSKFGGSDPVRAEPDKAGPDSTTEPFLYVARPATLVRPTDY